MRHWAMVEPPRLLRGRSSSFHTPDDHPMPRLPWFAGIAALLLIIAGGLAKA